jgi:hypothetical protein
MIQWGELELNAMLNLCDGGSRPQINTDSHGYEMDELYLRQRSCFFKDPCLSVFICGGSIFGVLGSAVQLFN